MTELHSYSTATFHTQEYRSNTVAVNRSNTLIVARSNTVIVVRSKAVIVLKRQ